MVPVGLSFPWWAVSSKGESAGPDRADGWRIFVGERAGAHLLGPGLALAQYKRK